MPENAPAWAVWEKYGWTLIDWTRGLFLISEAIAILSRQAVDDVEEELFKVAIIANAWLAEKARKVKLDE